MDETTKHRLLSAIREGEAENQRLEFKKRIELRTAAGKAEFIRDSMALANSANESPREPGYIVIGVKKGKVFDISSEQYDGATFKEIICAYIAPEVEMHYHEFNLMHQGHIGVIEFIPDSEAIYISRKDLLSERGEKIIVAGQSWKRTGDQKIGLSGDEIVSRVGSIISRAQVKAIAPLQRRLSELERVLTQSGPVAEVTRLGYVIEMEPNWLKIADELPKLIPYLRDYRTTAGPIVINILEDLAGRLSGGTPLTPLRSLTGIFRGLLATSAFDDALALEGKTLSQEDEWLIRRTVRVIKTLILDAVVRLKRPEIIEIFDYLLSETFGFAWEHGLQQVLFEVEAAYDDLQAACNRADRADIRRLGNLFSVIDQREYLTQRRIQRARLEAFARSKQAKKIKTDVPPLTTNKK